MNYHVYILQSVNFPGEKYIGYTTEVKKRLIRHNEGGAKYTSHFRPWELRTVISFPDKPKALAFEKYLKSHSGRAFIKKHF